MKLFDFLAELEIQKEWSVSVLRQEANADKGDLLEVLQRRVSLSMVHPPLLPSLIQADRIISPYAYTLLYLEGDFGIDSYSWWGVHKWHLVTEGVKPWAKQLGIHPAQVLKGFFSYQKKYGTGDLIVQDNWKKELAPKERETFLSCIQT